MNQLVTIAALLFAPSVIAQELHLVCIYSDLSKGYYQLDTNTKELLAGGVSYMCSNDEVHFTCSNRLGTFQINRFDLGLNFSSLDENGYINLSLQANCTMEKQKF